MLMLANMVKEYTVDFTKSLSSVTGNVTGFSVLLQRLF